MNTQASLKHQFETGIYRPPSEGGSHSLLIRVTRNCPWNRCGFCRLYKGERFEIRSPGEVKSDIDSIAAISNSMKSLSVELGHGGELNRKVAIVFLEREPVFAHHHGFFMVYDWLLSGAKTAFLQDANSLILPTDKLVEILRYLRTTFPSLRRVTSYARSKTLSQKKLADLKEIREAGLNRLHVGLESGDDSVLKRIKKGVTREGHIRGGKRAIGAGFELSEYWIPGLGGKELSVTHAENTARALTAINPHYIRTRPLLPQPGTTVFEAHRKGEFHPLTPREQLLEMKRMMEELKVTSKVCFDHATNGWVGERGGLLFSQSYEGYKFPDEKKGVLELIEEGIENQGRGLGG